MEHRGYDESALRENCRRKVRKINKVAKRLKIEDLRIRWVRGR